MNDLNDLKRRERRAGTTMRLFGMWFAGSGSSSTTPLVRKPDLIKYQ